MLKYPGFEFLQHIYVNISVENICVLQIHLQIIPDWNDCKITQSKISAFIENYTQNILLHKNMLYYLRYQIHKYLELNVWSLNKLSPYNHTV